MIKNLLTNWKTTSAGLGMIATAVIHLVFAIRKGSADESLWTTTFLAVMGGAGLVAAGDAATSQKQVEETKAQVKEAIETGHTEILVAKPAPPETVTGKPPNLP
jgi:hypothetical protein